MPTTTIRSYVLCPPTFFNVTYTINPWMDPTKPIDTALAVIQWEHLRDSLMICGHKVQVIQPAADLPDMVFAANGATVVDRKVLIARFRHSQRIPEAEHYRSWFSGHGYSQVRNAAHINEGEGDFLFTGSRILAGTGFRSSRQAHREAQQLFGRPVISLTLLDPRFYHLDTALAVLGLDEIAYYPAAFTPGSNETLQRLYPDAILATDSDALSFGLNAVSDGHNVVLPQAATNMISALRARGYRPMGMDVSELLKAGGGVKCCVLELR